MHTTKMPLPVEEVTRPATVKPQVSAELGQDLARLESQERVRLDRERQEELARLRAVQSRD